MIRGGARLIAAWKEMLSQAPKSKTDSGLLKLEVTARGEAGTTSRDWEVKLL